MIIFGLVFIILSCTIGSSIILAPIMFIGMVIFSAFEELSKNKK